ncbi:hypothetical protein GIB67_022450 [Kingdonia uniflora]|uniref:Uncharacterized protein n=1 Tax=Kingdonia uniflora TaxID=39325 RepID=A0A7J7MUC0_9MAGN|nr:hypothetical protein GIB67_022450 [Kingdonia uniflora]
MDEGSNVEMLDVIIEALLSMVLPAEEVSVSRRLKTIVNKNSEEEETFKVTLAGRVLEISYYSNYENVDENDPYKLYHRVYNESPGSSSRANPVNYIDTLLEASKDWVNSFFDSLKIKRQRRKKADSMLRDVPATLKRQKRKRCEGVSKGQNEMGGEELPRNYQFVPKSRRGSKHAAPVFEVAEDASRLRPRTVSTQTEKGKGRVTPESPKMQQSKVGQRKRRKVLGVDDTLEEEEEMTEVERQEQAVVKHASMVELWEDNPDEASKEIKRHMFQIVAWVQTCNKAIKAVKAKLQQVRENLIISHGIEEGEMNIIDATAGSTGDEVETSLLRGPSGGIVDGLVVEGPNKAAEAVGAGASVEQEGITTLV